MYLDFLVKIPNCKGKITYRRKSDVDYVYYEYDRLYDKVTQKTNPKRVTIGKKSEADPTKMQPNENILNIFQMKISQKQLKELSEAVALGLVHGW